MFRTAVLFSFIVTLVCSFNYAQTDCNYSKTHTFNKIKITIDERPNSTDSFLRNIHLTITANNNLIEKMFNSSDDCIVSSDVKDYDNDKNPEIIIVAKSGGSGGYGILHFLEFENEQLLNIELPELDNDIINLYRGSDRFSFGDKTFNREFPAYSTNDANCCPTKGECKVTYRYRGNRIIESDFVHTLPKGSKEVKLIIRSATGLPKMDSFSKTDCFIEIYVGEEYIGRTSTINNDNSPYFGEEFNLAITNDNAIRFILKDEDVTGNRVIGNVKILKPETGKYSVKTESGDGSIVSNGILEVEFVK